MATSATLLSMAHERKVENLRAFMVKLANSRGFALPETELFDQKFLDLCLSRTPDHPTYSAMILIAITELSEQGGSCQESISEFIKSKYKNLPYAHKSLLSHHLAKLVEKREILCDQNNYTLPEENKLAIVIANDQHAANEVMTAHNEEESVRTLTFGDHEVDLLEQGSLTKSKTSSKRKACGEIVRHTEDNGVEACLSHPTSETLRIAGVAEEAELALVISETEGRTDADCEGGELYEVVVLDEENYVLMDESGKGEENQVAITSKQRNAKFRRRSNRMKEARVEVNSQAYKRLWECQTEACSNIIALEKKLKQCRERDQQNEAVSGIDDVSHLPLSMESCKELWKLTHKIQSQLSEMIYSFDEAVVPNHESIKSKASENTFKQLEQKETEIDHKRKPQVKKRLRDIETKVLRKSPRMRKQV